MYVFIDGSIRKLLFVNRFEYMNKKLLYSKNNEIDVFIGIVYICWEVGRDFLLYNWICNILMGIIVFIFGGRSFVVYFLIYRRSKKWYRYWYRMRGCLWKCFFFCYNIVFNKKMFVVL